MIFYSVAAVTLIALSVGAVLACRSVAQHQAFQDAERLTARMAHSVYAPSLPGSLIAGSQQARDLHQAMAQRISDGYMVQVNVWDGSGRIAWASDPQDIGKTLPLPDEARGAIERGITTSSFDQQPEVSHADLTPTGEGLVEVYVPFTPPRTDGNAPSTMAFEAYYDYAKVNTTTNAFLRQLLPLVLIPLLLLQVIQVPIAASLSRRVRRQEAERVRLMEQNLTVSAKERIRIAADLHDGPIQDMAGIGYALGAISPGVAPQHRALMSTVETTVRRSIDSLRRMMIDLYPPDLETSRLPRAIADLTVPLDDHGIDVEVDVNPLPDLDGDAVTALYRVARESLANVVEHSYASHVEVELRVVPANGQPERVLLRVADDGVGIDLEQIDRRTEGHFGLQLLGDRVRSLGGTWEIRPGAEGGTVVTATVPALRPAKSKDSPGRPEGI